MLKGLLKNEAFVTCLRNISQDKCKLAATQQPLLHESNLQNPFYDCRQAHVWPFVNGANFPHVRAVGMDSSHNRLGWQNTKPERIYFAGKRFTVDQFAFDLDHRSKSRVCEKTIFRKDP